MCAIRMSVAPVVAVQSQPRSMAQHGVCRCMWGRCRCTWLRAGLRAELPSPRVQRLLCTPDRRLPASNLPRRTQNSVQQCRAGGIGRGVPTWCSPLHRAAPSSPPAPPTLKRSSPAHAIQKELTRSCRYKLDAPYRTCTEPIRVHVPSTPHGATPNTVADNTFGGLWALTCMAVTAWSQPRTNSHVSITTSKFPLQPLFLSPRLTEAQLGPLRLATVCVDWSP